MFKRVRAALLFFLISLLILDQIRKVKCLGYSTDVDKSIEQKIKSIGVVWSEIWSHKEMTGRQTGNGMFKGMLYKCTNTQTHTTFEAFLAVW